MLRFYDKGKGGPLSVYVVSLVLSIIESLVILSEQIKSKWKSRLVNTLRH